jgi:hypothetical protein
MSTARLLRPLLVFAAATTGLIAVSVSASPSAWSLHPTFAGRVGYDDNVFLQDRAALLPGVVSPAPDRAGSWFFRTSAALDATWKVSPALRLDLGYTAELVRYDEFASENHTDHRLDCGFGGRSDAWNYQLKSTLIVVDGDDTSPVFGHAGGTPALGGADVRARRDQFNAKLAGQLTRPFDTGFVRAVGAANVQDFQTRHSAATGYANYVDRAEWTVGLEGGRNVLKNFAVVAGVRGGAQKQADLLGLPRNYSNALARFLVGVEGHPRADLQLAILGGPDFRHYGPDVAPGFDRNQSARYNEVSATWIPRSTDTVVLTAKDYLWLSSGGRTAYQNTAANLKWKHTFNTDWSALLAADTQVGDSRDYAPAATERLDWIYTGVAGITRNLGPKTKLDLELTREWSDSPIDGKPGREYTHWLASIGLRHTY